MVDLVKRLEQEKGIWRVDGYNNIKLYTSSVPRIFVSLSQIKPTGLHSPLKLGQTTGKQAWINQPLNKVNDLLVGSCWEKGKRVSRLSPFEETYTVDTSKIEIFTLSEKFKLSGQIYNSVLPPTAIKLGGNFKQQLKTLYAAVPVLKNNRTDYLVVSCVELYRFYFGISTRYMNTLVTEPLNKYVEWNNPKLRIKTKLNRLEQFVAYRGHCSEDGQNWLTTPSYSIKETLISNENLPEKSKKPLLIKSIFPFSGITQLTIAGKKFKNKNDHGFIWGIYAANIIHCDKSVDFSPQIESDINSDSPQSWGDSEDDSGNQPPQDDDFDDEDISEEEEEETKKGRGAGVLVSSNRFSAMEGLDFWHLRTNESNDPVYPDGDIGDANNGGEIGDIAGEGKQKFESQTDTVDRLLIDFIHMIKALRNLATKHKWEINTRSTDSTIELEGEVITTFLSSKNLRKSWHKIAIGKDDEWRLRQVIWTEIALNENQYIYLIEMELKPSEPSRSTLCLYSSELKYMSESEFKTLLSMTATKNRWPKKTHTWKTDKAKKRAKEFYSKFNSDNFTHPTYKSDSNNEKEHQSWAEIIEKHLLALFI